MSKQLSKEIQNRFITLFKDGDSASNIARKLGYHTTSVTRVLKRNGLKMLDCKGKNHPSWKGGRGLKCGYWTVYCPDHPRAMNIRRVYEHILVAEKKYGRFIKKGEPIHHVDFDRQNNKLNNLYLCKNHEEHKKLHYSLEEVARELFRRGKLGFKNGKYYWKQ